MSLKHYLRDRRGVASIEAAFGTAALLVASLLAIDLYRLADSQTAAMHAAVTLADTMSRDDQLDAGPVRALAQFLHHEQFPDSDAVFIVSAVYKSPPDPAASPIVLWTETVELGPEGDQASTPDGCSGDEISIDTLHGPATLPDGFSMSLRELVIVAAVCVERTNTAIPGAMSGYYIVPARNAEDLARNLGATV